MCSTEALLGWASELRREAGRDQGARVVHKYTLQTLFGICPTCSTASPCLRRDLFPYHSDPNYTLIRRERKSVEQIILTTRLLWKLPSFSFQRHEIISVFSVTLISPTLLALFSHVGLALKNLT